MRRRDEADEACPFTVAGAAQATAGNEASGDAREDLGGHILTASRAQRLAGHRPHKKELIIENSMKIPLANRNPIEPVERCER